MKLFLITSLVSFAVFSAQAERLKDPMQPPPFALKKFQQQKNKNKPAQAITGTAKKPEIKPLKLTSILFSATRKIAIIDDQMLAIGDEVSGARLLKIEKHGVRLVRKGKFINLSLTDNLPVIRKTAVESKL